MPLDINKVDLIVQYALLVAGEEDDFFSQQLGPIHILKYVYLADHYFARRNSGDTFTGVDWSFYKFGPWSQEVNSRIEPALLSIMANKQVFPSDYGEEDWQRWNLRNSTLLDEKRRQLPAQITLRLDKDIHNFLKDTPSLLDFVYKTPPMINAAPNERLDFSFSSESADTGQFDTQLKINSISNKRQKKLKSKMSNLREEFHRRKLGREALVPPVIEPRHDQVFYDGVSWLDSLAGEPFEDKKLVVKFSPDVWKSKTRKGDDLP